MSRSTVSIFSTRLRATREGAGLSQRALGIAAGIDPSVASTRINRYERGVHLPDMETAANLAKALEVPFAYLVAEDDRLAQAIREFSGLSRQRQDQWLQALGGS